jgi:hypothetical protein
MKKVTYLIFSYSFLVLASQVLWSGITWPIEIIIDPTRIEYETMEPPVCLICSYISNSWLVGKNVPYYRTAFSDRIWLRPNEISRVSFDIAGTDLFNRGNLEYLLSCETIGQKASSQSFKLTCSNVMPNTNIDLGAALKTGQCIKE